jgi:putative DNA primase/helicase
MQRFQMLVYPDISGDWQYVDRAPNSAASRQAEQTYYRLVNTDITNRPVLCFAPDAQALFVEWLTELEGKVRDNNLHPALVSHLAKYRSLMPSLALLFELADGVAGAVSLAHAQQSAAWCDYLEGHARRIYAMLVSPERRSAAELGRRLLDGWKREEGLFTVRDVYQNDWRDLSTPDAVRGALSILRDSGWVRRVELDQPTKGRPSEIYLINPKVARRPE